MLFLCYPKCTTCQRARKWLDEHGVQYEFRDIKEAKPGEAELREWQAASGLPLKRFFNTSGLQYKSLKLKERLPGMTEEEAAAFAEEMRLETGKLTFEKCSRITASFGVAQALPSEEPDPLVVRADTALYEAKAAGKNTVRQAGENEASKDK